jgi:thioesterase superfamily protein
MPEARQLSEAKRALLEKYLQGDIPHATVHTAATTHRREAEAPARRERVVPVQTGGSKRPFFFLHGQWDGGFFCFPLARALGPDQQFYAIDPYTFGGLHCPPTLEIVAAAHVKSLRAVQPTGPYLLGGYCNGALVAYEMARQLHANGQQVALLALIDPMSPGNLTLVRRALGRLSNLRRLVGDYGFVGAFVAGLISSSGTVIRLGEETQVDWFLRLLHAYTQLREAYRYVRYPKLRKLRHFEPLGGRDGTPLKQACNIPYITQPRGDSLFPPVDVLRQDYEAMFTWVASKYAPDPYPGKVTIFWNSEEYVDSFRRAAWRDMHKSKNKNEVAVNVLPGTHATLRDEHIYVLAEHLRSCLGIVSNAASAP